MRAEESTSYSERTKLAGFCFKRCQNLMCGKLRIGIGYLIIMKSVGCSNTKTWKASTTILNTNQELRRTRDDNTFLTNSN